MLQPRPNATGNQRVPYLKARNVQWFKVDLSRVDLMYASIEEHDQFGVQSGDLLVCEGGEGGRCALVSNMGDTAPYIIQNALHRVRPRTAASRDDPARNDYLQFVLSAVSSSGWFDALNDKATIAHFTVEKFEALSIPMPVLAEQTLIVRFLNHATDEIERYIRAKEKLIALLEEQKQVMIHDAVTGRIDVRTGKPYPAYKHSGVEWLGDVPAHWDVRRLRNVGEALIGLTYDLSDIVDRDDGLLVLRASNIQDGKIVEADNVYVRCRVPDKLLTREGDILLCSRSGSRSLVGKNARIYAKCADVTFGAFMTVFRSANNDFLVHAFNSELFERQSGAFLTSTINQLTLSMLYGIRVPFPPMDEQSEIVCYLNDAITNTTHAIDDANHEIELFREYRTRLIADVVTGKLDVREAAANLPELEAVAESNGEITPNKCGSQQSNTTLHNEAPQTAPGGSS